MAFYYGITSTDGSFFSNYFGNNSSSNSLFSGLSNSSSSNIFSSINLSDYAMIRSGTYSKLMNTYYSEVSGSEQVKSAWEDISSSDSDTSVGLSVMKSSSQALYKSAINLTETDLYKATGTDEKGNATYDYDTLYKNVSKFVSTYNETLDALDNISKETILNKGVNMVDATSANEGMLNKIGISINEDNSLSISESAFKAASITDISSLFSGSGSYAATVAMKATQMYSLSAANLSVMSKTTASAYTSTGSYTISGISTYQGIM